MKTSAVVLLTLCLLVVCPYIVLARVVPQGSAAGMSAGEAGDYAVLQADAPDLPHLAAGGEMRWGEITIAVVMVVAVLIAAIFLLGDKLLVLFGHAYSQNGTVLLWLLCAAMLPVAFINIYVFVQMVKKAMKKVLAASVIPAFLTITLSYLLLEEMGLVGVGAASLAANTAVALAILIVARRELFSAAP